MPARVDGDLLVLKRLRSVGSDDNYEAAFSHPFGCNPCNVQPGPNSAIKVPLDHGPMRPHLLNGYASSHLYYLFYQLTPHFTDQRHLLTAKELCMPKSISGLPKFRLVQCQVPTLNFVMA
jgi:hypothetical protein